MRLKHSKLSEKQAIRLCEHFVAGTPARTAAELVGVNKNSATLFYHRLREIVAARIEDESPVQGEVEIDESYFGGKRKGLRGRGGPGKVAVFGILKRGGRVYTKMIPNVARATLMPIIKAKIELDLSSTPTPSSLTTASTSPASITTGSITAKPSLQPAAIISTASRTSGTRQSGICENTMASQNITSISSSKSASGASTTGHPPSS